MLNINIKAHDLKELIAIAYEHNLSILTLKHMLDAEKAAVVATTVLDDPMVNVSTDSDNYNKSLMISQKIQFPLKYYLQAKAQTNKFYSLKSKLENEKLIVRAKIISLYYSIYTKQKIIQMTQANMQKVKEFARIAEKKIFCRPIHSS